MRYVVSVLSMIQSNEANADRSMLLPETATMTTKTKATARTVFIFTSYLGRAPVVTNNTISYTMNALSSFHRVVVIPGAKLRITSLCGTVNVSQTCLNVRMSRHVNSSLKSLFNGTYLSYGWPIQVCLHSLFRVVLTVRVTL